MYTSSVKSLFFLVPVPRVDPDSIINYKREEMAKANLFVGSLAYATTDDSLNAFFATVGPVVMLVLSLTVIADAAKAFGFVEFENEDDNQKAIDQLNGKELDGRTIAISVARPKEDRPRGGNFGGNNDGNSFRQRSW